jgi:hypothetical protein
MKRALLLLLFATAADAAPIRIVGVECMRMVLLDNPSTLVCVAPLEVVRRALAQTQDLDDFIAQAYELLLLRHTDTAGFAYWRGELFAGETTRRQFIDALIGSSEFCVQNALTPRRDSCNRP